MNIAFINVGRLHPLIVHMPIGILIFGFMLYVITHLKKDYKYQPAIRLSVYSSFLFALMASITGWILSDNGSYDLNSLNNHKYSGIVLTLLTGLLSITYAKQSLDLQKYKTPIWILAMVGLMTTGHLGGSLTHGSDFLFEKEANSDVVYPKDIQNAKVYESLIQPIFKNKCVSCHNVSKQKGGLIMNTKEGLASGGENGKIINIESPLKSELLMRIHYPMTDKKHMPPKGKVQTTLEENELIEWWIENKACFDCISSDLNQSNSIKKILESYQRANKSQLKSIDQQQLDQLRHQDIAVSYGGDQDPQLSVSLANKEVNNGQLKALVKVKENIVSIDLSNSNIQSKQIKQLSKFINLETLNLSNTKISDQDLKEFINLKKLKTLNLYGTDISDRGLESLDQSKTLKQLYVWKTMVSQQGVNQFRDSNPNLSVNYGTDLNLFGKASLAPPDIVAYSDIFVDTVHVVLKGTLKNIFIHYTTDGSDPDTTSAVYNQPIILNKSSTIKSIAVKKGWITSEISQKTFIKTGHKAKFATLLSNPAKQYKALGAQSLIDLEKGGEQFRDGKWIGHEGQHLVATLELEKEEPIKKIFISSISEPGSWIFHPKGVIVSISEDGNNYKDIAQKEFKVEHRTGTELKFSEISIPTTTTKHLKLTVKSILKNPDWHPNPGGKSWVFVDEIMLN